MDIYAQNILDRYKEPFYRDKAFEADVEHEEANHSCGDRVAVKLRLDGDKAAQYSFSGVGCAISQAAADILGDLIEASSRDEILELSKTEIYEALGIEISLRRAKCALLALLALQNGLLKSEQKPTKTWASFHLLQ